jgi:hypothetical protein
VTQYQLTIDPSSLSMAANVTSEEASTINSALALLTAQGFTTIRDLVSIDHSGFIRQTRSTARFADGSTTHTESTFSDFGCAGTVLMPGQSGADAPPAGCVSPDTGIAPTTTTTTTAPPSATSTTTTLPPTTTTTSGSGTTPPG